MFAILRAQAVLFCCGWTITIDTRAGKEACLQRQARTRTAGAGAILDADGPSSRRCQRHAGGSPDQMLPAGLSTDDDQR